MSSIEQRYRIAQEQYAEYGVDTEVALAWLRATPISIHCWQVDDVGGFERAGATLDGGGIQATGNYPGKARTIDEARADYETVLGLVPGRHRLNLHASYGEFPRPVDRDAIGVDHFTGWMDWARGLGIALDFNCTCFSHPRAASGFTLSSKDVSTRAYWIEHVRRCRAIAEAMGHAQGSPCIHNVWIPDGAKDITIDRFGHRTLLLESLDACFAEPHSPEQMKDAVESKLFGIGAEWFTVGSHEFYLGYAQSRGKIPCLDMGHFHPTESVADKVSAVLQFHPELLLHVSRPIRWDSDHVVINDDPTRELALEIARRRHDRTIHLALDFFDASINRIAAYVIGVRSTQQALLQGVLSPEGMLLKAEEGGDLAARLGLIEAAKALPWGSVWDMHCEREGVPTGMRWMDAVKEYEQGVLNKRA